MGKKFRDLSEGEILALAIFLEEEDARVYADYADVCATAIPTHRKSSTKCAPKKSSTATA